MPKLTSKLIIGTRASDKEIFLLDDALPGFGLRIYPPSKRHPEGRRVFFVRTYIASTKRETRTVIGEFGEFTADQARSKAIELLAVAKQGMSPTQKKQEVRAETAPGMTVAQLAKEYLSLHIEVHGTPATIRTGKSLCNRHVVAQYGRYDVNEIAFSDVARHHAIIGKDHPEVANRMVAMLGAMLNWGTAHGFRRSTTTPCKWDRRGKAGVKRFAEEVRERFLSNEQVERLEEVLCTAESCGIKRKGKIKVDTCELIRLFLYTGARFNELHKITWSFVDLKNRQLRLYQTKEKKPKFIPLNDAAVEVLMRHQKRGKGQPDQRVFDCYNPQRAWMYTIRPAAGLGATESEDAFTIHGFRHNLASTGLNNGLSLSTVGKLLGHSSLQTTKRYAHFADKTVTDAMEMIGRKIKGEP